MKFVWCKNNAPVVNLEDGKSATDCGGGVAGFQTPQPYSVRKQELESLVRVRPGYRWRYNRNRSIPSRRDQLNR